jgi:hypothetical protein
MPTTPDRPPIGGGPPADPEDALTAAEAAHLAARETIPADVPPPTPGDPAHHDAGRRGPARRDADARDAGPRDRYRRDPRDADYRGADPRDADHRGAGPRDTDGRDADGRDADRREAAPRNTAGRAGPRPGSGRRPGRAPLPVAAAVATLWAALLSYLPVAFVMVLAQFVEDTGSFAGAARAGLAGWLLGHGVPLRTGVGTLGLAPLALAVLAAWRLTRAGVHVTRAIGGRRRGSPRDALTAAGAVGLVYGTLGALAASVIDAPGLGVSTVRSAVTLACFGAAAALIGALRNTGALAVVAARTPPVLRHAMRTAVVAVLLVLGAGAGFAGLSVATGGGEAGEMIGAYRTGVAGQAGITLVSMAYAPNTAVWAAAYLLGPGFAVGADTSVRVTEVTVGALPAVPVLAGLPEGPVGGFAAVLLAMPVVAAMVAGWLLARRMLRDAAAESVALRWRALLGAAVTAGPIAGVLSGAAALLSGGALGDGRLADMGPAGWPVAAAATLTVVVGAPLGAALTRALAGPGGP